MKKNLSRLSQATLAMACALCVIGPVAAQVAGGTTTVRQRGPGTPAQGDRIGHWSMTPCPAHEPGSR